MLGRLLVSLASNYPRVDGENSKKLFTLFFIKLRGIRQEIFSELTVFNFG